MKIVINIKTSGSAFDEYHMENKANEVDRILNDVKSKIFNGGNLGSILDVNGNVVGDWKVTGK